MYIPVLSSSVYAIIASSLFPLFSAKISYEFLTSQFVLYVQFISHYLIGKRFPLEEFLFTEHFSLKCDTVKETWVRLLPGAIFLRVMRPRREVDHLHSISGGWGGWDPLHPCYMPSWRAQGRLYFFIHVALDNKHNDACHVNCINKIYILLHSV